MEKSKTRSQKSVKQEDAKDQHAKQEIDDESDIFQIMITTDNHLGYKEDDKVVGNDSFYSFNEALQM